MEPQPTSSKGMTYAGLALSALPALGLLASAAMKLSHAEQVVKGFASFGFKESVLMPIGVIELLCTILYLVPQTAVLGAILLTGYLGGAIVTHLRVDQPVFIPLFMGVMLWGGLFLRDARLRALLPLRRPA